MIEEKNMEYAIIIGVILVVVLNVAVLIKLKATKSVTVLDERDKKEIKDSFSSNVNVISDALKYSTYNSSLAMQEKLKAMNDKIYENSVLIDKRLESIERSQRDKLEEIRQTLERNVKNMQDSNDKKLNDIKQTVDEKLTQTLNDRFKESFKYLTEELEKVTKTVGEMQSISKDVGNLTKVLSNVKTTGIFGEIQLGAIIEQVLSPDQYVKNVVTNKNGRDPVEFAVKMPGNGNDYVLMPIDSKFPYTIYNDMKTAYENNDFSSYNDKQKELIQRIKGMAKDIKEKYVCPPETTNFAVMFLPIEGLYAEVVKLGLIEELQQKYGVTVAGPTTMSALLNSLQMGFRTLTIQKKSNEVWKILGAVKSEFDKFNEILTQIQRKLNLANNDLDTLIGVRSRMISNKLKNISVDDEPFSIADKSDDKQT